MDTSPVWPGAATAAWSGDENARPDGPPTAGRAGAVGERSAPRPLHLGFASARTVRLSYPPRPEQLWGVVNGRIVRSPAYRDWQAAARAAIRACGHPVVVGPYLLRITAHRPTEAEDAGRDLDSLLGPLTSALGAAGLIGGEALAERIVIRWARDAAPGGRLEVEACAA